MRRYVIPTDGSLGPGIDGSVEALAIGDLVAELRVRVEEAVAAAGGAAQGRVDLSLSRSGRSTRACVVYQSGRQVATLTVEHVATIEPRPGLVGRLPRARLRLERAS